MPIAFDSMVAASLLDEELPIGLKAVASTELGADNWGKGSIKFGEKRDMTDPKWSITPLYGPEGMGVYCARDTAYSHMLYPIQRDRLKEDYELARLMKYLCLPGMDAVLAMERNGVWLDVKRVEERRKWFAERKEQHRQLLLMHVPERFRATANFEQDAFLRKWMFSPPPDGLGIAPMKWTPGGAPSVDQYVLKAVGGPAMDSLRLYNNCTKALEFCDSWLRFVGPDSRLHPNYNMTGARSGRRSCDNPNLMQTPRTKLLRSCIGAPDGWIWFDADYSQIEVRLVAVAAEEDTLLKLYREGRDIYKYTAAAMYGIGYDEVLKEQRQYAKAIVLGFLYGMQAKTFIVNAAKQGLVFSDEEAEAFRDTFFSLYPRLVVWHSTMRKEVKKNLQVRSPIGRIRHLKAAISFDRATVASAERQGINSPIQGMGGDCTLAAMAYLNPLLDPVEILLVLDVHDMIAFQIREDVWQKWVHLILTAMEELPNLRQRFDWTPPIRLKAEGSVGHHWAEGVELTLEDFEAPGVVKKAWLDAYPERLAKTEAA